MNQKIQVNDYFDILKEITTDNPKNEEEEKKVDAQFA